MSKFNLNGTTIEINSSLSMRLIDFIRLDHHQDVKEGCGEGECGACSVIINDEIKLACLTPLANVIGKEVITASGLKDTVTGKAIYKAYSDAGAVQCGFCTPGMVMSTLALLKKNPHPTLDEIKIALSGNLCRCTGYNMIFKAVESLSKRSDIVW